MRSLRQRTRGESKVPMARESDTGPVASVGLHSENYLVLRYDMILAHDWQTRPAARGSFLPVTALERPAEAVAVRL